MYFATTNQIESQLQAINAGQVLRCHIDRLPDPSWRRCPGSPRNRWLELDQLCRDNSTPLLLLLLLLLLLRRKVELQQVEGSWPWTGVGMSAVQSAWSALSCWPLETSRHTWTLGGDAMVLDNCALATMTRRTRLRLYAYTFWRHKAKIH